MRKHRGLMLAATLLFLAWTGAALAEEAPELIEEAPDLIEEASDPAEEAPDLTGLCTFDSNGRTRNPAEMLDGDLGTYFPLKEKKGEVIISCPEPLSAVYIQVFDKYGRDYDYDLQIRRGGEWQTVDRGGKYLSTLHTLPEPAEEVKIVATARERLRIAEIRAAGDSAVGNAGEMRSDAADRPSGRRDPLVRRADAHLRRGPGIPGPGGGAGAHGRPAEAGAAGGHLALWRPVLSGDAGLYRQKRPEPGKPVHPVAGKNRVVLARLSR